MTDVRHLASKYSRRDAARQGEIADLAAAQHGVIARRQLEALGVAPWRVEHELETRRLHRLYLGVYAVGHARLTARGRWMGRSWLVGTTPG
jgi:hypothetical protein